MRTSTPLLLAALPVALCGCASGALPVADAVSPETWQFVRDDYHYRVFDPGRTREQNDRLRAAEDARPMQQYAVRTLRARCDTVVDGITIPAGGEARALGDSQSPSLVCLLPPVFLKIVPVAPTLAYAQRLGASTFERVDLVSGERSPTTFTQFDAVPWHESPDSRSGSPYFGAEPDPGDARLWRVTLLGPHLAPACTVDRVPASTARGNEIDYVGGALPDVSYLASDDPERPGLFVVGRMLTDGEHAHRLCAVDGSPLSPDVVALQRFDLPGSVVRLAVEVEPALFRPLTPTGVPIWPLPAGLDGYRPLFDGERRLQGWALRWSTNSGRRWTIDPRAAAPWRRDDPVRSPAYLDLQCEPPGRGAGVALLSNDGRWDAFVGGRLDRLYAVGAEHAPVALQRASMLAREPAAADLRAEHERARRLQQSREQEWQEVAQREEARRRECVDAFERAGAASDLAAMYEAAAVLGGSFFVRWVVQSGSGNPTDLHNAHELAQDPAMKAAIASRLAASRSDAPQGGDPATVAATLQAWLAGGHASDPRARTLR